MMLGVRIVVLVLLTSRERVVKDAALNVCGLLHDSICHMAS